MRRLALLLVVASVLVACSGDDGEPSASTVAPTAATAPTGPVGVAVTPLAVDLGEPGQAPRSRLEHALTAGSTSGAAIDLTLTVEGVTTAEVTGDSSFTVEEVAADGSASASYALEGLDVGLAAGGGNPSAPIQDALEVTGTLEVTADRVVTAATAQTTTSGEIPGIEGVAASLDPQLLGLMLPFPAEPVGPGATWEITGPLPLFGTSVELAADVELVERRGDRFTLAATIAMASPGGGTGPVIDLEGLGRLEGDLTQLALLRGTVGLTGTIVLADRGPDQLPMTLELGIRAQ